MVDLLGWVQEYVRSADANYSNIDSIDLSDNIIVVNNKSTSVGSGFKKKIVPKVITYQVDENLLLKSKYGVDTVIVVLNTAENVKVLVDNFEEFAKYETLKILFCNPATNDVWQLHPYRHKRLCTMMDADFKTGIISLFESSPEYTVWELVNFNYF